MGSSIDWFSTYAGRTASRPVFPDYLSVSYDYGTCGYMTSLQILIYNRISIKKLRQYLDK